MTCNCGLGAWAWELGVADHCSSRTPGPRQRPATKPLLFTKCPFRLYACHWEKGQPAGWGSPSKSQSHAQWQSRAYLAFKARAGWRFFARDALIVVDGLMVRADHLGGLAL